MDIDTDSDESIDLEELDRLQNENTIHKQLNDVRQHLITSAGENAILRANLDKYKHQHQEEISELLLANNKIRKEFEKELELSKQEIERLKTESQFLRHDMASMYRSSRSTSGHQTAEQRRTPTSADTSISAESKASKSVNYSYEAMFRSGFDTGPLSPKRKKLKTIIRDEQIDLRESGVQSNKRMNGSEKSDTVKSISTIKRRDWDLLRSTVYECRFHETNQIVMENIDEPRIIQDIHRVLFPLISDSNISMTESLVMTCLDCISQDREKNSYLLLYLIENVVHQSTASISLEIQENIIKSVKSFLDEWLNNVIAYSFPTDEPPFRNVTIPRKEGYSVINISHAIRLFQCLSCIDAQNVFDSIGENLLVRLLSVKLPSQLVMSTMNLICQQPAEKVRIGQFSRILDDFNPPENALLFLESRFLENYEVNSESIDIRHKPDETFKREMEQRNRLNMTQIRALIIKRLIINAIETQNVRPMAEDLALIAAVIHCLNMELELFYNTSFRNYRLNDIISTRIKTWRIKLLTHCVQLLHAIWNLFPESHTILSNLDAKYAYEFSVALARIAFSSDTNGLSQNTVDQARDLLEQTTTLSEADDIYLSMNPG